MSAPFKFQYDNTLSEWYPDENSRLLVFKFQYDNTLRKIVESFT